LIELSLSLSQGSALQVEPLAMHSKELHRWVVFDHEIDTVLKEVCLDIAKWYDIPF